MNGKRKAGVILILVGLGLALFVGVFSHKHLGFPWQIDRWRLFGKLKDSYSDATGIPSSYPLFVSGVLVLAGTGMVLLNPRKKE